MDEQRRYHRTVIEVEVLSEHPYSNADDLGNVHYDITDGDCSGDVRVVATDQLTPEQAAAALLKQGSDPGFFGLDNVQPAPLPASTVTVSAAELDKLKRDQATLDALYGMGVDNWEGYDEATRELREQS